MDLPKPRRGGPYSTTANGWVLILEGGGRFSAVYDSTMILRDAISTGPFRNVDVRKNAPPTPGVEAVGGGELQICEFDCPPRNCCFGGTLTYSDPITSQIQPLHNVKVLLNITGPNGGVFETQTSFGAYGGLPCPMSGETGSVSFVTQSSLLTVNDLTSSSGTTFATVSPSVCGTTIMNHNTVLSSAIVFAHVDIAWRNANSMFGKTRPPLLVEIQSSTGSQYDPGADKVRIHTSNVGGQGGGFAQAHEFGHALQTKGFAHGNPGSGMCSGAHFLGEPNTAGCATSEGWADYFSIVTLPTNAPDFTPADCETNSWVLDFPTQGHLIEGAVAAYYLDASDGLNPSETDGLDLGPKFVADIISGCTHVSAGPPSSIVDLRNCFENNLSPSGYQLSPAVVFPGGWTLSAMLQDFSWNISGSR